VFALSVQFTMLGPLPNKTIMYYGATVCKTIIGNTGVVCVVGMGGNPEGDTPKMGERTRSQRSNRGHV